MVILKTFILVFVIFFCAGCAKLAHIDQLLMLQDLSIEQEQMNKDVKRQEAQFDRLVQVVQEGDISGYKDQKSVVENFGKPIRITQSDGVDVWVYRYSAQFFNSPKVYLYWDKSGQLVRWSYEPSQDKANPSKSL